jgi:hypothetical protein
MKKLAKINRSVFSELLIGLLLGGLLVIAIALSIGTAVFVYQGL